MECIDNAVLYAHNLPKHFAHVHVHVHVYVHESVSQTEFLHSVLMNPYSFQILVHVHAHAYVGGTKISMAHIYLKAEVIEVMVWRVSRPATANKTVA